MKTTEMKPFENYPATLAEVRAQIRPAAKASQAENRFLGRIKSWTDAGARVKLEQSFSPRDGYTFTAQVCVAHNSGGRVIFLAWTLRLPHTATELNSFRRVASLRFFGRAEGHKDADESLCSIAASNALESNKKWPREDRHVDGFALDAVVAPTLPATPSEIVSQVNLALEANGLQERATTEQEAVDLLVAVGVREIKADIRAGRMPQAVPNFSTLHDYVDANEYALLCTEQIHKLDSEILYSFSGLVQDRIDAWLKETVEHRSRALSTAEL